MQHSTPVLEEEASRVDLCINPDVQGDGIQYVEWDSIHPSQGLEKVIRERRCDGLVM